MVSPVMADMLFLAFRFRDALVRSLRTLQNPSVVEPLFFGSV